MFMFLRLLSSGFTVCDKKTYRFYNLLLILYMYLLLCVFHIKIIKKKSIRFSISELFIIPGMYNYTDRT